MNHQQHFLVDTDAYRELLGRLPLAGRTVVDLGMGHGEVTRLVLDAGVDRVIGIEIDPSLPDVDDPRVEVILGDFRHLEVELRIPYGATVVSNPPYDLLADIFGLLKRRQIHDVVLMVPEYIDPLPGYNLAFKLSGNAFQPPAKGRHLVMTRGWGCQ